ncbi:16S rRNA (guanine(527)-N(7))-methyltransferase RsmG [bacterium]|nr:16S rRNA (guanine(527)-N(7))-methyltransferase RsmG [bacterium]
MDKKFEKYAKVFLEQNSKINLISKNDEKYLWEKHIKDSLAISYFFEKYDINPAGMCMLDIGTGGGFPALPVAIVYPQMNVTALDSIRKKINAISDMKDKLNINNLNVVCDRAENLKFKYKIITARAVSKLSKIIEYAVPLLEDDGYFIAYKSLKAQDEIDESQNVLKKFGVKVDTIIPYELSADENFKRNLVVIRHSYSKFE